MKGFSSLLSLCALLFVANTSSSAAEPQPQKNLLLITVDDMNADSPGWMGNKLGATPNLDAFAKTAHRFMNHHNTCPICQPGREALLTGRVPHSNGGLGFTPIRKDVPTIVEVLQVAGYYTAAIEKIVHMAPAEKFPWHEKHAGQIGKDPAAFREAIKTVLQNAKKSNKPFFVNANITDPHRPFLGAQQGAAKAKGKGSADGIRRYQPSEVTVPSFLEDLPRVREELAQYYSSIRRLDVSFGAIMEELSASGLEEQTIVVFWSDHGMSFPFSKATVYRNGTWSPLLIRWKGMGEPQVRQEFLSSVDCMPAWLELLNVPAPQGMDGRSWLPLLQNQTQPDRDYVVTHVNTVSSGKSFAQRCIRTADYALMFHAWVDGTPKFRVEAMSGLSFAAMQAEPKVKKRVEQLTIGEPLMFFDLKADPDERHNRIDDPKHQTTIATLASKLIAEMERTQDPQTEAFRKRLEMWRSAAKRQED